LRPRDVKDGEISQQALYYQKSLIKREKPLNVKQKVVRRLSEIYKESKDVSKYTLLINSSPSHFEEHGIDLGGGVWQCTVASVACSATC
jgi:hypothetical protein